MNRKKQLNEILSNIYGEYCDFYNEKPLEINFVIADDLSAEYSKLRSDLANSGRIDIDSINDNNGLTVPHKDGNGFTVLLNQSYILEEAQKNSINYLGTIAHEITHVYDFVKFKSISGYNFDEMLEYSKNLMFTTWTEFNAKVKGYLFLRKNKFANLYDRSQVSFITDTELPYQLDYMMNEYNKTDNGNRQLYVVSHFLARLYVWQHLFPMDFSADVLETIFGENNWMKELYDFFAENRELESAMKNKERFNEILRMNFK